MCRALYFDPGEDTPCGACIPELMAENITAVQVWTLARNQLIYVIRGVHGGMIESYPVDVDIPAVIAVMEMMGVGDRVGTIEKVQTLFGAWAQAVEELREARRAKSED
jgi:hypothetical protein